MKKIGIISLVFILIDFIVKIIVNSNMNVYDSIIIIPNFFSITYVRNIGAAFSIMENSRILFIIIGFVALILIYKYLIMNKILNKYLMISYSMLIGGIIGNMIDRIIYGYVIDYLSFNIFGYNAPIFNLADTFIVVSIIMLLLYEVGGSHARNSRKRVF